ncbi:MAG: chromate resistance protein [Xanthomonadaceae bacterium]|nr:chromate resistance protein [Xanthomonadaceae bacterium]
MNWLILILSLPTENATVRMRAWRMLKAAGAAVLRDGVYLLPARDDCRATLETVRAEVQGAGGMASLLEASGADCDEFPALFSRREAFAALLADIADCRGGLAGDNALEVLKQARKLRKAFSSLCDIDFFPDDSAARVDTALVELETAGNRALAPDEPRPADRAIEPRNPADYRGRRWATRRRPWVDRLACAWLIRRCIDPEARILWLDSPADMPADALGFDFDGAAFTHVGDKVSFETLLASFGLQHPALRQLGALVHYLDVGGAQPGEAAGVERILAGLRATLHDDDRLLQAASDIFDGLLAAYEQDAGTTSKRDTP